MNRTLHSFCPRCNIVLVLCLFNASHNSHKTCQAATVSYATDLFYFWTINWNLKRVLTQSQILSLDDAALLWQMVPDSWRAFRKYSSLHRIPLFQKDALRISPTQSPKMKCMQILWNCLPQETHCSVLCNTLATRVSICTRLTWKIHAFTHCDNI